MLWNCKPENVGICKINGQRVLFYIIIILFFQVSIVNLAL